MNRHCCFIINGNYYPIRQLRRAARRDALPAEPDRQRPPDRGAHPAGPGLGHVQPAADLPLLRPDRRGAPADPDRNEGLPVPLSAAHQADPAADQGRQGGGDRAGGRGRDPDRGDHRAGRGHRRVLSDGRPAGLGRAALRRTLARPPHIGAAARISPPARPRRRRSRHRRLSAWPHPEAGPRLRRPRATAHHGRRGLRPGRPRARPTPRRAGRSRPRPGARSGSPRGSRRSAGRAVARPRTRRSRAAGRRAGRRRAGAPAPPATPSPRPQPRRRESGKGIRERVPRHHVRAADDASPRVVATTSSWPTASSRPHNTSS